MRFHLIILFTLYSLLMEARLPDLIPYRKGNLWGFCDSNRVIRIKPRFEKVSPFSGGTALIYRGRHCGMIDSTGKVIVRPFYEYIDETVVNGCRIALRTRFGRVGAINESGKTVVPFVHLWMAWSGKYLRAMKHHRYGVYNSLGEIVIPFDYEPAAEAPDAVGDSGLFVVKLVGSGYRTGCGVIDTNGKVVIPFNYYYIEANDSCGFMCDLHTNNTPDHYYNLRGQFLGETDPCPRYGRYPWPQQFSAWGSSDQWNWVNADGTKLSPVSYQYTSRFSHGYAAFKTDSGYGYVNEKFEVVIEPAFWNADPFREDGLANVSIEVGPRAHREGYIDIYGTRYWED